MLDFLKFLLWEIPSSLWNRDSDPVLRALAAVVTLLYILLAFTIGMGIYEGINHVGQPQFETSGAIIDKQEVRTEDQSHIDPGTRMIYHLPGTVTYSIKVKSDEKWEGWMNVNEQAYNQAKEGQPVKIQYSKGRVDGGIQVNDLQF